MNTNLAKFIKNVTDEIGNQECRIHEGYSGRGMCGQTTTAVSVASVTLLLADLIQYMQGNISKGDGKMEWLGANPDSFEIADIRKDNLGNDTILY